MLISNVIDFKNKNQEYYGKPINHLMYLVLWNLVGGGVVSRFVMGSSNEFVAKAQQFRSYIFLIQIDPFSRLIH
jgi:hypothetical protein